MCRKNAEDKDNSEMYSVQETNFMNDQKILNSFLFWKPTPKKRRLLTGLSVFKYC